MAVCSKGVDFQECGAGFFKDAHSELSVPPAIACTARRVRPEECCLLILLCCMADKMNISETRDELARSGRTSLAAHALYVIDGTVCSPTDIAACAHAVMDSYYTHFAQRMGILLARDYGHRHTQACIQRALTRVMCVFSHAAMDDMCSVIGSTRATLVPDTSAKPMVVVAGGDGYSFSHTDHVLVILSLLARGSVIVEETRRDLRTGVGQREFFKVATALIRETARR